MYIDWVISLSLIIVALTCVFLVYGVVYFRRKIHDEDEKATLALLESGEAHDIELQNKHA